jgi:hypothetical protein
MNERDLIGKMNEQGLDLNKAETLDEKVLVFERTLKIVIQPRNQSDRTGFRNVTNWLRDECKLNRLDSGSIFRRVLDFAIEASGPGSKNPAAVFMSILKKELGYKK